MTHLTLGLKLGSANEHVPISVTFPRDQSDRLRQFLVRSQKMFK